MVHAYMTDVMAKVLPAGWLQKPGLSDFSKNGTVHAKFGIVQTKIGTVYLKSVLTGE
jgi:hypothetical protein